jgi:diaminopimelate decarboxylase
MTENPPVRRLADWSQTRLSEIASEYGTPAYVVDLDRIRENVERVRAAFPDAGIHYAVKANAGHGVLGTLAATGIGAECASAGEVRRAIDAGFAPEDVLYTPVNPPDRDLDAVLAIDGPLRAITVGATDTIDRLAEREFTGDVAVRIHPGTGAGHSEAVATGADAKFGIALDRVPAAIDRATAAGMSVVGLHAHAGSGILDESDLDSHRAVLDTLAGLATDLEIDLDFVDVGGGFGVPYRPAQSALDLEAMAESIRTALAPVSATLRIEPGRYLVADAGVLLTEVNTVKPAGEGVLAGVDAGMTDLLRPALYDAFHPVTSFAERETATVTVVGPICESTDVLARERTLPAPARGDILAIGMTGAYGIEMASQYNSRPRAPVVAVEGGTTRTIRRREQLDDVTAPEQP